jgi:ankyrin repeat protein
MSYSSLFLSTVSYLSPEIIEEKLDEFSQQTDDFLETGRSSPGSVSRREEDASLYNLLQELAGITGAEETKGSRDAASLCPLKISKEASRLLWETANVLSDARPPADLCVYNKAGDTAPPDGNDQIPPIFDGSVANATPPPLGGSATGASGGAGTILHLACAMDLPLVLAFLLSMGTDGRASHTAFRRLMIHEAACNGSIGCLTLLLEMGKRFSNATENERGGSTSSGAPFFPDTLSLPHSSLLAGTSSEPAGSFPPITMNLRHFRRESTRPVIPKGDYLALLRRFRALSQRVRNGEMKQLDAARALLENAPLPESTKSSLIRSCAFKNDSFSSRTFLRPHGSADGHGNTPLHWAAFKNETECVSLLLEYEANPNARAHPSGWTPLHDAAYSNSPECIELLVNKGARVDARANSGATPLCFAAQEDASGAALLLLQKGADLTARCAGAPQDDSHGAASIHPHSRFSGYTPLHYCAHYNAHKASHVLLAHAMSKAAMETPDLSGRLPIHVAVARGSSDVLRELLHAGARIDLRPNNEAEGGSPRLTGGPNSFFALPETPRARRPPSPESPTTPNRNRIRSRSSSTSPVTSPVLRSMIPQEPINSSKPWNCLTQRAIDECKDLISKAEQSWSPDRHLLFTPQDRKAVMELLRVGKRLEQQGVLFVDLWPQVLGFCGRGWFDPEPESLKPRAIDFPDNKSVEESSDSDDYLALPSLSS